MTDTGFKSLFSNARNKLASILMYTAIVVLGLFALVGGYVFWYMHTAKPAKGFCSSIQINSEFDALQSRAKEEGFELREKPGKEGYEKVIAVTKQPNGESQCLVHIQNNMVVKKRYVLYL